MSTLPRSPIHVTQPFLPPLSEFIPYLEEIWRSKTLTNGGPIHEKLEHALCAYLGVEHISLFNNGTTALLTALQALRVTGEVITTPYSFVATAHSLLWNGLTPVFVDIDRHTLNIDPSKIEAAITSQTTAILPVHCYGNPCDVQAIQKVADAYNLKVIYDAAHAFGVRDEGGSVLRYGDLSVLSFHATKVFNTFEGGAIISPNLKTKQYIDRLKNFGFVDETTVVAPGINGKMNEISAAFGLLQLDYVDEAIRRRESISRRYSEQLHEIAGIEAVGPAETYKSNFSYFPILVHDEFSQSRDDLYLSLKTDNVHTRRYFYPLISDFPMYRRLESANRTHLPIASWASDRILCLPIYPALQDQDVDRIVERIKNSARELAKNELSERRRNETDGLPLVGEKCPAFSEGIVL